MSERFSIGYKFCGHCQPRYAMGDILKEIKKLLPDVDFVHLSGRQDLSVVLLLNACPIECTRETDFSGQQVFIPLHGYSEVLSEEELAQKVVSYLKTINILNCQV